MHAPAIAEEIPSWGISCFAKVLKGTPIRLSVRAKPGYMIKVKFAIA